MNSIDNIFLVDGKASRSVDLLDRGFSFGDGVFETLRLINGKIPLWSFHKERLSLACQRIRIPYDSTLLERDLGHIIEEVNRKVEDSDSSLSSASGAIKIVVTRGLGGRASYPPDEPKPTLAILFRPYSPPQNRKIELVPAHYSLPRNANLAGLKHLNRLDYILSATATPTTVDQELLFCDSDQFIIETMHHNLFFIKDEIVYTPCLTYSGVEGVLRRVLIEHVFPELHLVVNEGNYRMDDLRNADEIFISNALAGVESVHKIQDKVYSRQNLTSEIADKLIERTQNG